jgi:hypothetical protein
MAPITNNNPTDKPGAPEFEARVQAIVVEDLYAEPPSRPCSLSEPNPDEKMALATALE